MYVAQPMNSGVIVEYEQSHQFSNIRQFFDFVCSRPFSRCSPTGLFSVDYEDKDQNLGKNMGKNPRKILINDMDKTKSNFVNKKPSKLRVHLKLPGILPRRLKTQTTSPTLPSSTIIARDPDIKKDFDKMFLEYDQIGSNYSYKFITTIKRIGKHLTDEEVFNLLKFLLLKVSTSWTPTSTKRSRQYAWLTFFYCIENLSAKFFNDNLDITALILLKCYEFLTLKTDDDSNLKNLQETLEHITGSIIQKISLDQRETLVKEILAGDLPCSVQHQYDKASLDFYLLRMDKNSL